jgi:Zn-dependent protease with chaperone function
MRAARVGLVITAMFVLASGAGCAAPFIEIRHHPQQARLERLLQEVLPHTKYPEKHYWVRVASPSKGKVGLAVFAQRHIYLAEPLVDTADDAILRALIAHAVAHHRLHHYNQRGAAGFLQQAAFKAGGAFVPGLSNAHHVGGPVTEQLLGPRQEASADHKTVEYLRRMSYPAEDFARALETLVEQDLAERVGHTSSRGRTLTSRAARVRRKTEALPAVR